MFVVDIITTAAGHPSAGLFADICLVVIHGLNNLQLAKPGYQSNKYMIDKLEI